MKRTLATAALALTVVLCQTIIGGSAAQADTASFVVGEASASSQVVSVSPALSGYSLGVRRGSRLPTFTELTDRRRRNW